VSPAVLGASPRASVEWPAAGATGRWRWAVVTLCAGASLGLYLLLLGVVPDLSSAEPSYAGELFPWVRLLTRDMLRRSDTWAEARFLLVLVGLFALYGRTLRAVAGRRSGRLEAAVAAAGATFLLLQLAAPALLSTDLFSYVMYGRIFAVYGVDPYSTLPHYHSDPYEPLSYWKTDPSFYGPLWTVVSAGLALVGGERIGLTVLLFRALTIGATLGAGALIWACLRRLAPQRAAQGLVFFLWNPLVVLEYGLSGHNDVAMAALLLLGVWLHLRGRPALAVVALTLSALVKFATALIVPLYLLMVLRGLPNWWERARYLVSGAAAAALTVGIVLGLAHAGPQVLAVGALGSGTERYMNSIHGLAFEKVRLALGEEPASVRVPLDYQRWWVESIRPVDVWTEIGPPSGRIRRADPDASFLVLAPQEGDYLWVYDAATGRKGYVRNRDVRKTDPPDAVASDPALARMAEGAKTSPTVLQANALIRLGSWAAFGAFLALAAWRATDLRRFLVWSAAALLTVYWLVAAWFWPWYVVWALALAALVPSSRPAGLAALLSASALSLYATFGFDHTAQGWIFTYRSLPIFLLPLVLFGLAQLVRRLVRSAGVAGRRPAPARQQWKVAA
jgi:hypothetical protein